jgi:hydrogenase expression/formation protein HypC
MCLAIPSKVVEINQEENIAVVDTFGTKRQASLNMMEEGEVQVGDYVLIHIGFVMEKIDEEYAKESLKTYQEILEKMDEEENGGT